MGRKVKRLYRRETCDLVRDGIRIVNEKHEDPETGVVTYKQRDRTRFVWRAKDNRPSLKSWVRDQIAARTEHAPICLLWLRCKRGVRT